MARLLVVCGVLVALRVSTQLLGPGSQASLTVFGVTEAAVAFGAAVYLAVMSAHRTFAAFTRHTYRLMATAFALWAVGQTIFAVVDVLDLGPGAERTADVLFFGFGAFMVAAAVVLLRGTSGRGTGLRTVLDGFLMGLSLLTVLWVVWFSRAVEQYDGSHWDLVLPFTFPVLDVVFLTVVVMTGLRVQTSLSGHFFGLAALAMAVADGVYVYGLTTPAGFVTGGPADYLWIVGFSLYAVSAGGRRAQHLVVRPGTPVSWSVLVPYVALLPAAGFSVLQLWSRTDRLVLGALLVLTLLALVRQFLVLSDHRRLLQVNERQRDQLAVMAHIDSLTGLVNRRRFSELLEDGVRTAMASSSAIVVAFVDLDRFKVVNDTLGHQAGDELLRAVADRLRSCVRPGDWAGRWGGDEFAVLVTDPFASAEDVVNRLRDAMAHPFTVAGHPLSASASVGAVREVPGAWRSGPGAPDVTARDVTSRDITARDIGDRDVTDLVDALLAAADAEMYVVKRGPTPVADPARIVG